MSEAPETAVPRFRRNDGRDGASPRPSRDMLNVIREARYVQDNAAELLRSMGKNEHSGMPRATREQSPELAAAKCAADLGIEPPRRAGSGKGRDGQRYSEIRERIESQSVFTMQAAIPAEDRVSGFALVKPPPAVILVNSRDRIRRRIFTLLHEYAHAVLNDADVASAVGDVRVGGGGADGRHDSGMPDAEQWCDRFAGAVLMPREKFLGALRDVREEEGDGDPLRVVTVLSDKFCVTKTAALTRTGSTRRRQRHSGILTMPSAGGTGRASTGQRRQRGDPRAARSGLHGSQGARIRPPSARCEGVGHHNDQRRARVHWDKAQAPRRSQGQVRSQIGCPNTSLMPALLLDSCTKPTGEAFRPVGKDYRLGRGRHLSAPWQVCEEIRRKDGQLLGSGSGHKKMFKKTVTK